MGERCRARLRPCPAHLPRLRAPAARAGFQMLLKPHRFAPRCHLPRPLRKLRGDAGNARCGQPRCPRHRHQHGTRSRQPTQQPGAQSQPPSEIIPKYIRRLQAPGHTSTPHSLSGGQTSSPGATRSPGRPWAQPDLQRCGTNGPRARTDPPRQGRALGRSPGAALCDRDTGGSGVQEVPISSHQGPTEGTGWEQGHQNLGSGSSRAG